MTEKRLISIRIATTADGPGILACLQQAFAPFRDAYTEAAYQDTVLSADTVQERLSTATVYVATDALGEIIATVGYLRIDEEEVHIRGMAVLPRWQGQGVAEQLLARVEAEVRARSFSRMTLGTTRVLERARRFYQRNGFRRHGAVGDFFGMELFDYVKELVAGPDES